MNKRQIYGVFTGVALSLILVVVIFLLSLDFLRFA